jgi:hypothetical protein
MWAVEHHLTQRVMRQFELYQEYPPMYEDTDRMLHRYESFFRRWPLCNVILVC